MMGGRSSDRGWEAEPQASFARRLGKPAKEITFVDEGGTGDAASKIRQGCPEIWELSNGDVAVIGRDLTEPYAGRLPDGVSVAQDERVVVIPQGMLAAAKKDIPDA